MRQLKINNRFVTQKRISQGSFGFVMQGLDQQTGDCVAIKIERPENEQTHSIDREVDILAKLSGVQGVPQMIYYGWEDNNNVIVLELLSKDLSSLIKQRKKFSLKTTLQISIELVQILARVHERGVLHRDLKPENMMLDETNKIYLIDFGISKIYIRRNGIMIPFKDRVSFVGTSRYASIAAHKGYELARKDDLESLMFVMLYFVKGNLPWQNLKNVSDDQRTHKIGEMKENIDPRELFRELPQEFQKIYEQSYRLLRYLRKLAYTAEPDYKAIVRLLQQAAKNSQIILDYKYDWDQQTEISRCGTLPVETPPLKQFEKFASNVHRSSNLVVQSPKQLQPPIMKQESNQNSGSGSGNNNFSIYNSMGMFFQMSMDEISEESLQSIPDENQASVKLYELPDHLKKPTQDSNIEENNVVYNRMQSLSVQVTQIFHHAHK